MSVETKLNTLIREQRAANELNRGKAMQDDLIDEEEACRLLGWKRKTMLNYRKKKLQGMYVKLPSRKYMYLKSKLLGL